MITTYFLEFDTIPTYTFPAKTAYPCGKVTPTRWSPGALT